MTTWQGDFILPPRIAGSRADWNKAATHVVYQKKRNEIDVFRGTLVVATELEVPLGDTFAAIQAKLSQYPEGRRTKGESLRDEQQCAGRAARSATARSLRRVPRSPLHRQLILIRTLLQSLLQKQQLQRYIPPHAAQCKFARPRRTTARGTPRRAARARKRSGKVGSHGANQPRRLLKSRPRSALDARRWAGSALAFESPSGCAQRHHADPGEPHR